MLVLQVLCKQLTPAEAQVAKLAAVGAGTHVQTLMRLHVALLRKSLEAELALKGPFASVCAVVALKRLLVDGRVGAEAAVEAAHIGCSCCAGTAREAAASMQTWKEGQQRKRVGACGASCKHGHLAQSARTSKIKCLQ